MLPINIHFCPNDKPFNALFVFAYVIYIIQRSCAFYAMTIFSFVLSVLQQVLCMGVCVLVNMCLLLSGIVFKVSYHRVSHSFNHPYIRFMIHIVTPAMRICKHAHIRRRLV